MFKKFIFAVLSLFYCANIVSSDQLGQDADEQLKTLQTIKIEVLRSFPSHEVKKKLSDVITSYEKSDKSLNSYLNSLKELKSITQNFKVSTTFKLLFSGIVSLICFMSVYKATKVKSNSISPINKNDIKKAEELFLELKNAEKDFIENYDLNNFIKVFNEIDNLNFSEKGLIVKFDKYSSSIFNKNLNTHLVRLEGSLTSYYTALSKFLDRAKEHNKSLPYLWISSIAGFALPYPYFKIQDYLINDIEKLIDEAIQDAESKLTI